MMQLTSLMGKYNKKVKEIKNYKLGRKKKNSTFSQDLK